MAQLRHLLQARIVLYGMWHYILPKANDIAFMAVISELGVKFVFVRRSKLCGNGARG